MVVLHPDGCAHAWAPYCASWRLLRSGCLADHGVRGMCAGAKVATCDLPFALISSEMTVRFASTMKKLAKRAHDCDGIHDAWVSR